MRRSLCSALVLAALAVGAACGGDDGPAPVDAPIGGDILDQLRAQPEIDQVVEQATTRVGYRYFEIWFTQPIDHDHPERGTFRQYATLIHRDPTAPLVLLHTGYGNWYYDYPGQVTRLYHANQLVIEHRFFRTSRPAAIADWASLTIAQAAADHHVIATVMHRLYGGPFLETGASKGGMTSIYHRRFWPDDVDATVAYVAPISFAAPDYRYEPHLEAIGPPACRTALRQFQAELLRNRRAALEARAAAEAAALDRSYTRVALPAAVESAVVGLEWAFWQFAGAASCADIPPVTASDEQAFSFLQAINEVGSSDDDNLAEFEAYYYQAEVELGYPGHDGRAPGRPDHLPEASAYDGAYPREVVTPAVRAARRWTDVDAWVRASGERIVFLYGEWDPWSGGMFDRRRARRGGAGGGAGRAPRRWRRRPERAADRALVLAKVQAWTGRRVADVEAVARAVPEPGPPPPRPSADRAAVTRSRTAAAGGGTTAAMAAPRTALVTGSTDGIGKATALALAKAGLRVVIHGRNRPKVDAALAELAAAVPGADLHGVSFDLGSFTTVRRGAAEVLAAVDRLDVLVCNAGIYANERVLVADGLEATLAVNHVGHVLLTELLHERLIASAPARVIVVSSVAHTRGRIHLDDLSLAGAYTGYAAYAQSKLANLMHALDLAAAHDPKVLAAYALHPGVISTKLLRDGFAGMRGAGVSQGAATIVKLATAEAIAEPSGTYYNEGVPTPPSASARDAAVRAALRAATLAFAGLPAEA
jgi:NAD(P)-dependent dehydrogenase (short-subunit alcohol dehydrogenase family)